MTDDWDFYSSRVDGKPASFYVDLGAEAFAPLEDLPHMAYLRQRMQQPRDDGLSNQAEFDQLIVIEDALTEALRDEHTAFVLGVAGTGMTVFVALSWIVILCRGM